MPVRKQKEECSHENGLEGHWPFLRQSTVVLKMQRGVDQSRGTSIEWEQKFLVVNYKLVGRKKNVNRKAHAS